MQQAEVFQHGAPATTDITSFASGATVPGSQLHPIDPLQQPKSPPPSAKEEPPIICRPPLGTVTSNSDELAHADNFPDDAAIAAAAGEVAEGGGATGNRWPRQETVALLKIRSEMDAAFRDATLKGPLWIEVSRKLAELGYKRSTKKCREKFENVHKYYKRTKDSRAGRPDGKSYRFFDQLEALKAASGGGNAATLPATTPVTISFSSAVAANGQPVIPRVQPFPISAAAQPVTVPFAGVSFSSNSSSSVSASDSEDEVTEEGGGGGSSRKMMALFEGLMKQLIEKQEVMQLQLLETMEKREQDRMIREEAWRRQEVARLSREQEILAQERAMAAARDAIFLTYLEKITSQSIPTPARTVLPLPQLLPVTAPPMPVQPLQQHRPPMPKLPEIELNLLLPVPERHDTSGDTARQETTSSSRWPEAEVDALIKIRSGLESRYDEAAPKGPLWEEISAGMQRLGFNRRAKKCKEKWENINKYFKKVKESNKRRREDAKTCPYFHQLDALHRRKLLIRAASSAACSTVTAPPNTAAPSQGQHQPPDISNVNSNGGGGSGGDGQVIQSSNGGIPREEFVKELMRQQHQRADQMDNCDKMEETTDSDNLEPDFSDYDDEDYDDDDEKKKMEYKIQFQRLPTDVQDAGEGNGKAPAAAVTDSFAAMAK